MSICLLESACALNAVDAGIWKIRIPHKGDKSLKRRLRPGKRRFQLDKAAVVAVQEDPALLALRYRTEAAKNRRLGGHLAEAGLALGRVSPTTVGPPNTRHGSAYDSPGRRGATSRCHQSPSPYGWGSASPSPSPSPFPSQPWSNNAAASPEPRKGLPLIEKSRWQADGEAPKAATTRDEPLHLPPVNRLQGNATIDLAPSGSSIAEEGDAGRGTASRSSWKLELPRIAPPPAAVMDTAQGGQPVKHSGARRGRSSMVGKAQRSLPEEDEGDVTNAWHPFKQARAAIRRELSDISTKQELLMVSRDAEMALTARHLPHKEQASSMDVKMQNSLVSTVRTLLVNHLPRASDEVRRASMEALLKSEVKRRFTAINDIESQQVHENRRRSSLIAPFVTGKDDASSKRTGSKDPKSRERSGSKLRTTKDETVLKTAIALSKDAERNAQRKLSMAPAHRQSLSAATKVPIPTTSAAPHDAEEDSVASFAEPGPRGANSADHGRRGAAHGAQSALPTPQPSSRTASANDASVSMDDKSTRLTSTAAETGAKVTTKDESNHDAVPRRELENVFNKFVDDGSVHRDDMMKALQMLGFTPKQHWVDQAFAKITKYTTIRLNEFGDFVREYFHRQREAYAEAFFLCDEDNSGSVEVPELAKLLQQFSIEPMKHVLEEVIKEVDKDGSGVLDLSEFYLVMDILRGREGFSLKDHDALLTCFRKFDRDKTGTIDRTELCHLLSFLGIGSSVEVAKKLIHDVDENGNDIMSEREFLLCMRKVRDSELRKMKEAMCIADSDNNGTLSGSELKGLLEYLGYWPSEEAIVDAAATLHIDPWAKDLDLSELWQLLQVFRQREGFGKDDFNDIEETFKQYSHMNFLSTQDLDIALRWMGQEMAFEVLRTRTYLVDIDASGQLDFHEFAKLVRMNRDAEIHKVLSALTEADSEGKGSVTIEQAVEVLKSASITCSGGEPPIFLASDLHPSKNGKAQVVDQAELMNLLSRFRRQRLHFCRNHNGFTYAEVDSLREAFMAVDEDRSGELKNSEMVALLDTLFPEMSSDALFRPRILGILKEIDTDGNGSLSFQDFLRLMRKCHDMHQQARFEKEKQVLSETQFSAAEVHEFRQLFLACDVNNDQELCFQEFKKMIASICPMGDKNSSILSGLFNRATRRQSRVEGRRDQCDYPEFLWLLHHLLETNFGGIRDLLEINYGGKRDKTTVESRRNALPGNIDKADVDHLT